MLRLSLLVSLLVGCTHPAAPLAPHPQPAQPVAKSEPAKPEPAPRNFVCERVSAEGNPKAICTPEVTTQDLHRARVTIDGQTISCVLPAGANEAVCGHLFYQPPPPEEKPASTTKKASGKGVKK